MSTASDAGTINNISNSEPIPTMPTPLADTVQLLRGVAQTDDEGNVTWHDVATVRELTGEDEEKLAALESRKDLTYIEYTNAILGMAVDTIGDLDVKRNPGVLNYLILADRDILFLGVLKATYGRSREFQANCPKCGTLNDIGIDLETEFPMQEVPAGFDVREPITVKLRDGSTVKLRLQNGSDVQAIQKDKKADSTAKINTLMLSRCVLEAEGNTPEDPVKWAQELGVADRKKLINALLDIEIGPQLQEVNAQCSECGYDMPIALNWVSLLLG